MIKRKYLRFEQMGVFRPMPVPDAMRVKIRQESEKAKQLAASIQKKPMELPIGSEK